MVVRELHGLGATASGITVDVKDEAAVNAMVADTVGRHGRLDVLVNNAGINIRKPPHELSLAEWREVLETNLTGAFLASHAAYPHMTNACSSARRLAAGACLPTSPALPFFCAARPRIS